ncbi:hypothetical protein BV898_17575 [Hypsibius exemplaris]|uniref:Uncharacterized protein n=1 Tax=Hypsibius exemplaris TaxID=2072580 RepID=A0A9X6NFU2_HYPEX|nr:hypothetical protein BV898_17575 [Hypsibius exemplaris]
MGITEPSPRSWQFVPLPLSLYLTGLLPRISSSNAGTLGDEIGDRITTGVGLALIVGALGDLALQICRTTYRVAYLTLAPGYLEGRSQSGILSIMGVMPAFILSVRGITVMIATFWKRDSLPDLFRETEKLLTVTFLGDFLTGTEFRKFRFFSLIFLLPLQQFIGNYLNPMPVQLYAWQYACVYAVLNVFPFLLSQHVYIGGVVLSWLLRKSIQTLKHELIHTIEVIRNGSGISCSSDRYTLLTEQLRRWERILFRANCVASRINHSYGWVFLATHVFDALNMLCLSSWIFSVMDTIGEYAFALGSVIVFGVYATVFPIPMVMVAEEANRLAKLVHMLITFEAPLNDDEKEASSWRDRMCRFEMMCLNHSCMLSAVTVEFSRRRLVGVSFLAQLPPSSQNL